MTCRKVFWLGVLGVFVFGGCKSPDCGMQKFKVGVFVENQTGEALTLHVTPKRNESYLAVGASDVLHSATAQDVPVSVGGSFFYELWTDNQPIPTVGAGKVDPGKCGSKSKDPRAVAPVVFSADDMERYRICRGDAFTRFVVMPVGQSCPAGTLILTTEANNGPVRLAGTDVAALLIQECDLNYVDASKWQTVGTSQDKEQERSIAGSFAFNCDIRHWYPTLNCIDPAYPPRLSSTRGFAHCADASGNIRKEDSWVRSYGWDDVFCLSEHQNQWVTVTSMAHASTHYLYCSTPDLKYPWPWDITDANSPYRTCLPGQKAVLGATAQDFACE